MEAEYPKNHKTSTEIETFSYNFPNKPALPQNGLGKMKTV